MFQRSFPNTDQYVQIPFTIPGWTHETKDMYLWLWDDLLDVQGLLERYALMEYWLIGVRLEKRQVRFDWIVSDGSLDDIHNWWPQNPFQ